MNTSYTYAAGIIFLSFPIASFYGKTSTSLEFIMFILCSVALGLFFLGSNSTIRKYICYYLLLAISFFIINNFVKELELYYFVRYFILSSILFYFFLSPIKQNLLFFKSIAVILIVELGLFFTGFLGAGPFFPNNSIFSILIASQFAFLSPWIVHVIKNNRASRVQTYILKLLPIFFCCLILAFTSGRAGLLGFIVAMLVLNIKPFKRSAAIKKIFLLLGCIVFFGTLLLVKPGSSKGRVIIYKVIFKEMQVSKMAFGIGLGQFKSRYNQFQSRYFSSRSIDGHDASLVDNTYFAFNDPFQLFIETGIFGLVIFTTILLFIFKKFISDSKENFQENNYLTGSYLCAFSFLTGSFFSYPFQILSLLPIMIFSLANIFNNKNRRGLLYWPNLKIPKLPFKKNIIYFITTIGFAFMFAKMLWAYKTTAQAEQLSKAGFKLRSVSCYSMLSKNFIVNPNVYYKFSSELASLKKIDSAILVLQKSMIHLYNDKSATLIANLYYEKGMIVLADSFYREAVFINPKSFRNRFHLFQFYYDIKQTDKAIFWGHSIINLQPKVLSESVTRIKNKTNDILGKIK